MRVGAGLLLGVLVCGGVGNSRAQTTSPEKPVPTSPGASEPANPASGETSGPVLESGQTSITVHQRLTKAEERKILSLSDAVFAFASKDTGLPIEHPVKKIFVSREQVNRDLRKRFDEDKGNRKMQQSELVLKKFGLLDRDFQLRPFLLSLLTEQIAGFYDNKTKTMNLLDWVPADEQESVMAHELTHALQDQRVDLKHWEDIEPEGTAKDVAEDNRHIDTDESGTARDAVLEGQAMVSFADYTLMKQGVGKTLKDMPEAAAQMMANSNAADMSDSPVLARAPLVLQQSLLFPYGSGLLFEQQVERKAGVQKAFADMLAQPPSASAQILHPDLYLRGAAIPVMHLPDLHPALEAAGYAPYDVGVMGELDVRMTAELFGGKPLAEALAPNWNGGVYYAAQRKSASDAEKKTTASLALLYDSQWKNPDSAESFFHIFEEQLPRQYDGLVRRSNDETDPDERVYSTREGDILLRREGSRVWVSEGFALPMAREMRTAVDGAQGVGPVRQATLPFGTGELTGPLRRWMSSFGMIRAALR